MENRKEKGLYTKPLDETTWADFARLVEKHNGVWGGCWCIAFHPQQEKGKTANQRRLAKHRLVMEGRAHAALVYDGDDAIGWCQFGSTAELPGIKNRRKYEASQSSRPDWRITCFFVDRDRRGEGVTRAALRGALQEIAESGGGSVEGYPEDIKIRTNPGFLCSGTTSMFEREGFRRTHPIGMHMWVVTRSVRKSPNRPPAR
ncbi:MAG: GNAT family N-acetyltransferase [Thermoplasmata archaeon]